MCRNLISLFKIVTQIPNRYLIFVIIFIAFAVIISFFPFSKKTSPVLTPISAINLNEHLKICESIPNNTTQEIAETTRLFINLPEDIYPFENRQFTFNGATAGIISSGERLPPKSGSIEEFVKNKCATHYYDFEGNGTVDLKVKSAVAGLPDYTIYFIIKREASN